jgi:hypothetical protein
MAGLAVLDRLRPTPVSVEPETPVKLHSSETVELKMRTRPAVMVGTVASVNVVSEAAALAANVVENRDWNAMRVRLRECYSERTDKTS